MTNQPPTNKEDEAIDDAIAKASAELAAKTRYAEHKFERKHVPSAAEAVRETREQKVKQLQENAEEFADRILEPYRKFPPELRARIAEEFHHLIAEAHYLRKANRTLKDQLFQPKQES